jgi:predicted Zn finger-like uncharacterized protein
MPISVVCPGCKARFAVSDKFAGKKGPCPKCKAVITVPDQPAEDVKIHVPEQFASGGKDATGRPVLRPITRKDTKLSATNIAAIASAVIVTLAIAFLLRGVSNKLPIIAVGLLVVSPPLAVAGYTFLRDDELEPYRARALLIRATLCGLGYAALWSAYPPLVTYGVISGEPWQWLFVAPAFVVVGAGLAFACLDLDFGSAAMHYCFYVVVTLLLRFAIGLPPVWDAASGSTLP